MKEFAVRQREHHPYLIIAGFVPAILFAGR
jgi:hypothetical protein